MNSTIMMDPVQRIRLSQIKISCNKHVVVDSGSVIIFDRHFPIILSKRFSDNFTLRISISQKIDGSDNQAPRIKVDSKSNTIEFVCYNFDNTLGTGTADPIEIGNVDEKKIFIHFWLYALGGKNSITRKLEYTIWSEE